MPMPKTVGSQSCQYTFTINNRFIFILFQQQSQHHQQRFTSSCLVASYIYRSPAIQAKDEVRLKKKKTEASWSNLFGVEVDKFLEQLEHLADTQLLSSYSIRAGMVGDFWSQLYIIHVFSTIPLLLQLVYEFILYFIPLFTNKWQYSFKIVRQKSKVLTKQINVLPKSNLFLRFKRSKK